MSQSTPIPLRLRALAELELRRREKSSDKTLYLKLHPAQRIVADSGVRFKVVVCARRWGKTFFGKATAVEKYLQGQQIWWILPSIPMAIDTWHDLKNTLNGNWDEKQEQHRLIRK